MMEFPKTVLSLNPEITDELIVEQIRKLRFGPELENLKCPHCGSKNVHKYGKMHNRKYIQRYYCKNCEKTFNDLTGTILEKCRLTPRKALLILYLYFTGNYSASRIAREVNIDVKTAHTFTAKARRQAKFFQELINSLRRC